MVAEKKLATALRDAHRANGEAVFRLLRTGHGPHPDTSMRELNHGTGV